MDTFWTIVAVASFLSLAHLALGFALGYWLHRSRVSTEERGRLETVRAKQLLECLRELTSSMAVEVDEHKEQLASLTSKLSGLESAGGLADAPITHLVIEVVSDIMQSNQQLKDRLTSAEIQLQQQATEIETSLSRAMTDPLTGLPNRRAFDDDLERRMALWQRRKVPLSLALLDIDYFKRLNDTYGHSAGDKVLRQVAGVLKGSFRTMDLVARFGGEEFAVILPDTVDNDARCAARKTLQSIREARFSYEGKTIEVTISAGLATARDGESAEDLIKRADAALYASKNAGRDCGHFHDGNSLLPIGAPSTIPSDPTFDSPVKPPAAEPPQGELDAACAALGARVERLLVRRE